MFLLASILFAGLAALALLILIAKNPIFKGGMNALATSRQRRMRFGLVGPQYGTDGSATLQRNTRQGGLVVQQERGKYFEAALRGVLFSATTAVSGVAPGTALGTTAAFCLFNPANSGKLLALNKAGMGFISGTFGPGVTLLTGFAAGDAIPTGTAITPLPLAVGNTNASVAKAFTTATVTTNAAKMIKTLWNMYAAVTTTAINNENLSVDLDGEVVIFPGYGITIHSVAGGGSSPLVIYNVTWEEVGPPY